MRGAPDTMDMRERFDLMRAAAEQALEGYFKTDLPAPGLGEAMRYSLLAGGKRVRAVLVLAFCQACGGSADDALPFASAVEMLHAYSLIHDDLPCMDDDDLRRGKPTNHKVYGECVATLAGDALQAAAFSTILSSKLDAGRRAAAALCLADAAGERGMCAGQYLDMAAETVSPDLAGLRAIQRHKTAALISAACQMGVIAAGGSEQELAAAREYADGIGLAFQIRDDILDITSSDAVLGKNVGSDAARGKPTFASLMGLDAAQKAVREHTDRAIAAIGGFREPAFLGWLAQYLAARDN